MPQLQNQSVLTILTRTVNLSSANLLALGATPFTLVPAPGAGKIIAVLDAAIMLHFGTRPYFSAAGSPRINYASDPTLQLLNMVGLGSLLLANQSQLLLLACSMANAVNVLPGADNSALQLSNADLNAGPILTSTLNAGGAGYAIGDTGFFTDGNGDAAYNVLTVDGLGAVLTYSIIDPGTGYVVENNSPSATGGAQPGAGAGFTINITAVQKGDGTLKVTTYYAILPVP